VACGGGRALVRAFEEALQAAGATVWVGSAAKRIHIDDQRRFSSIELDTGEHIRARQCISAIHPKQLLDMVEPGVFPPAFRNRVQELEETPSAFVLFGRCPASALSGNLTLASGPHTVDNWQRLSLEERPLFIASPADASHGGVSVICPATLVDVPGQVPGTGRGRPAGYLEWKAQTAQRLLKRLGASAGDLLGPFELLDVATPLTFRDWMNSPQGGLYGIKHRSIDLPLLPRTRVKGLYMSGQAIVAPGVLGAVCAGFLTESCLEQ